jgi:hypothetical protein
MQEVEEWYNKNSSNTSLCELMEFIESQVENTSSQDIRSSYLMILYVNQSSAFL